MRIFTILALLLSTFIVQAQGPNTTIINIPINGSGGTLKCLVTLPDDYGSTSKNYPIIMFGHGIGEGSNTDPSVLYNSQNGGPAYFVAHSQWPTSFVNPADGQSYKFIVISPQGLAGSSIPAPGIDFMINFMLANYRVDINRLYMTGLSAGAQAFYFYITNCPCNSPGNFRVNPAYAPQVSVLMSIDGGAPDQTAVNTFISKNVHTWAFGSLSETLGINTGLLINGNFGGNNCNCTGLAAAGLGRFTSYTGGHCCWKQFYDPIYRETVNGKSMNIYEYMLQYTGSSTPVNSPPVVNAGSDQAITLPTSTVTLTGTASDIDGTIASYAWTQTAGTSATITSPSTASTSVTGMTTSGTRTFQLTVTDDDGAQTSSPVNVVVSATPGTTKTVNVNLYGTASYIDAAWNNWQVTTTLNSGLLKYSDGSTSAITSILSSQVGYSDNGASYPVTMCPQQVGRDASYSTTTRTNTITGLDNSKFYDIQLYATRGNAGQTTRFTIGSTNVDIATNANYTNIATFSNINPSSGQIVITLNSLSTYNYLNGFTLTEKPGSGGTNQAPVANAGSNQNNTLPTSTATLTGSGTDADGSISSYAWTQTGGTTATITSPNSATTGVSGMTTVGVYTFQLTVTDNLGATGTASMSVTVNQSPAGTVPRPPYPPKTYSKIAAELACAEYQTVQRMLDGSLWLWAFTGGHYVFTQVSTGKTAMSAIGAQYGVTALNSDNTVITDIRKADNGTVAFNPVPFDAYGNPFNYVTKIKPFWQTNLALGHDSLHYWGPGNALSYGSLGINGGANIPAPVTLKQPPGRKIVDFVVLEFATAGMHVIEVLCDDGTVWFYDYGSDVPTQAPGITNAVGVFAITRACYGILTSDGDIKCWGPFASYAGLTDGVTVPTSIKSALIAAGAIFPLKKVISSYNTLHVIDANNHLFGRGDNMQGEVGNGIQYGHWATYNDNGGAIDPFAWSFRKGQLMQGWVQIPGEWANVWGGENIAFFFYGMDMFGNLYFWGRCKQDVGGTGQRANNDDAYADWGCIPSPERVNPPDVSHAVDFIFDPAMIWFPRANAGIDRLIAGSSDSLYGSGSSQPEGSLTAYSWRIISGPGTIQNSTNKNTLITGMAGIVQAELTVTGTNNQTAKDTVTIQSGVKCFNCLTLPVRRIQYK